ncbi:MAG: MBL fold metallo-hydrolase [Oscillospiraceae bacterium]|nr:MBL fold metallo-hydrolase [Oscillospiraceae bacterium]
MNFEIIDRGGGTWVIVETMVCAFLLEGSERALLIDSGLGTGNILEAVKSITDKPVILANTHADPDHIGGNKYFDTALMAPSEFAFYASSGIAECRPAPLHDGDIIDLGGRELEAILTPGHTPGSTAFLDKKGRFLISGDGVSLNPIFMFGAERSFDAYIDSMERLKARSGEFDAIYPSHGTDILAPEIFDRLIATAHKVKSNALPALDPPFELPAKMYTDNGVSFFSI